MFACSGGGFLGGFPCLISLFALAIALLALHEVLFLATVLLPPFAGKAASFQDDLTTIFPR
jgi:hypothetical protein